MTNTDNILDWFFNTFDELCLSSKFKTIDNILKFTDTNSTDTDILICLLTISNWAKTNLIFRTDFYNRVEETLKNRYPDNFQSLIVGLK